MTITINPFVAGIVVTLLTEFALMLVASIVLTVKQSKKNKPQT